MQKYSKEEKDSSKPFEEIRMWNFEIVKSVSEFMNFGKKKWLNFRMRFLYFGSQCFSAVIPNMFNDLVSLKIH